MSAMDAARYQRLKTLMIEALEYPDPERERFINEACGEDDELRADLLRLIGHSISDGFLADSAVVVDEHQQAESIIGTTIGRIRIDRLIARGGMGEVYAGEDQLLKRPVAVKLIRNQWRWSDERRAAFLAEARALSALAHPNICQVHDFFSDEIGGGPDDENGNTQRDVLVLELINGRTLRDLLDHNGRPSRRTALDWASQIADALVSAHERGVAHRDLKPDNIMLTDSGQIKVLDFGLARSLPPDADQHEPGPGTQVAGTPGYLAPEQALGERATPASDIWSFGLVLIELLTGEAPFDKRQTGPSLLDQARKGEVRIPDNHPRAETKLLRSVLDVQPNNRPSARGLRQQLQKIQDRPKRRLIAAACFALAALLIGGAIRYTLDLQTERDLAETARIEAEGARLDAERARDQAEDLAQFMLQDLYDGLDRVGRLDLLEPVADKAVEYFVEHEQDPADKDNKRTTLFAGIALLRSAKILEFQGRLLESIEVMREAIDDLRALRELQQDSLDVHQHLSFGLQMLSAQLNTAGQHAESQTTARESLTLAQDYLDLLEREKTVDLQVAPPDSLDGRIDIAWDLLLGAWYALSESGLRGGDFDLAIESADQALALVDHDAPDLPVVKKRKADLAWTRCLALLQTLNTSGKVQACEGPLEIDRAQIVIEPENVYAKSNLSNSLWLMSLALRQEGQHAKALVHAQEAASLARELIAWDPEQPQFDNLLSVTLISQARILDELQRDAERVAVLEEALGLTSAMIGEGEDHQVLHNHATVLALLERPEQARPWAVKLMDSGWNRPAFILLCQQLSLDPRCEAFTF